MDIFAINIKNLQSNLIIFLNACRIRQWIKNLIVFLPLIFALENQWNTHDKSSIINKIPINDVSSLHHPIVNNFFNACKELGIKFNKNLNTYLDNQIGHYNINTRNGYRFSSSNGFLKAIIKNPRLKIKRYLIIFL